MTSMNTWKIKWLTSGRWRQAAESKTVQIPKLYTFRLPCLKAQALPASPGRLSLAPSCQACEPGKDIPPNMSSRFWGFRCLSRKQHKILWGRQRWCYLAPVYGQTPWWWCWGAVWLPSRHKNTVEAEQILLTFGPDTSQAENTHI